MKLTRLLLLLALMVSMLAAPEAFGAKTKRSSLRHPHRRSKIAAMAKACEWFDITCSDGSTDECCGSVDSCLGYCAEACGEDCIYVD